MFLLSHNSHHLAKCVSRSSVDNGSVSGSSSKSASNSNMCPHDDLSTVKKENDSNSGHIGIKRRRSNRLNNSLATSTDTFISASSMSATSSSITPRKFQTISNSIPASVLSGSPCKSLCGIQLRNSKPDHHNLKFSTFWLPVHDLVNLSNSCLDSFTGRLLGEYLGKITSFYSS